MNIISKLFEVVVALLALVMAFGAIAIFALDWHGIPYLVFMSLIIYLLVPRAWGVIGFSVAIFVASFYLIFLFITALFWQPMHCLMSCALSLVATILLLRGKPSWMKWLVLSIFIVIGVYYVFNNDIVGPVEFAIRDRPIDTPSQWYNSYRFFWTGIVVEFVTKFAGFLSVLLVLAYQIYPKVKSFSREFWEEWCC